MITANSSNSFENNKIKKYEIEQSLSNIENRIERIEEEIAKKIHGRGGSKDNDDF